MDKIRRILAPTDLSEPSQAGVRYALILAKALGAEVTAYHVVNHGEFMPYGEASAKGVISHLTLRQADRLRKSQQLALARFLNEHFSDLVPWVRVREKVELGLPDKNIVEWATKEGTDLIVISIHGRVDLSHPSVGHVADQIVRNAPCPVLSVHSKLGDKACQKAAAVA